MDVTSSPLTSDDSETLQRVGGLREVTAGRERTEEKAFSSGFDWIEGFEWIKDKR